MKLTKNNLLYLIGYLVEMLIDYGYDTDGIIRVLKTHNFTEKQIKQYAYLKHFIDNKGENNETI